MVSDAEHRDVVEFLYREARLADEARYAEWLALWTDDGVYWVPATTDPGAEPDRHLSHIDDNRARIDTRVKLLQTGHRYSQEPASLMRRVLGNVEDARRGRRARRRVELHPGRAVRAGRPRDALVGRRTTHRLRHVDGLLRMSHKKVVLVNAAEPLPNLAFLI
jgi:benzoate/toluate 1,2-dioxygenase beta subunit